MYSLAKLKVGMAKHVIFALKKPTPVTYIGAGRINKLPEILMMNNAKKVFIIASNTVTKKGLLNQVFAEMKEKGIEYIIYNGVKPDPTFDIVAEVQALCRDCDVIVGIGGGSVLDTAKTVNAAVSNNIDAHKLTGLLKVKQQPRPLILAPTTAGTGSETTIASVISDTHTHMKKQILDPKTVPMCAILDPNLMLDLPVHTTVTTTMDALTHALEAYVSLYATKETDQYSEIAVKLIFENLPKVVEEPSNVIARENLLMASFYAGMSFTRAFIGYVHAFSHTLGGKYGISHGLGNAVLLPHVMKFYLPVCADRFAKLATIVGYAKKGVSEKENAVTFINALFEMNSKFGMPAILENFPAEEIDEVIRISFKECHGTYPVPKYFSQNDARNMLKKIANNASKD